MPGYTRENVGELTPADLLDAIALFDRKMEAGPFDA